MLCFEGTKFQLGVLLVVLCKVQCTYILSNIIVNSDTLTLTSFHFNHNSKYSEWVDRIFGAKSVFNTKVGIDGYEPIDDPISVDEAELRHNKIKESLQIPQYAFWPTCSIEMLGFVLLDSNSPFKLKDKHVKPNMGVATLLLDNQQWDCFYRPLYENWRTADKLSSPNYWTTVIYCPMMDNNVCIAQSGNNMNPKDNLNGMLVMKHPDDSKKIWQSELSLRRLVPPRSNRKKNARNAPSMAICTCLPYMSSDFDKVAVNGALLYEWTRYYLNLGLQVIIYDRGGNHSQYLFNSKYGEKQLHVNGSTADLATSKNPALHPNLVYHPYTILSLLDTKSKVERYDNSEDVNEALVKFDNDHQLSLTQCRFEAKATLGIETVIVADFDEFLYCPAGGPHTFDQGQYIRHLIRSQKSQGVDQISFYQRVLANRTAEGTRDCAVRVVNDNATASSVFDCFAPVGFVLNDFLFKSAHTNHACPMTGDHLACALPDRDPRSHDCLCESVINEDCGMYHLSTRASDFREERNTVFDPRHMQGTVSELYLIANNVRLKALSAAHASKLERMSLKGL